MDRRAFVATAAGVALGTTAGCLGESSGQADPDYDVSMSTVKFRPAELTVTPGTTVVWKNTSSHAHTVTAYEDGLPEDADYWASGDFDSESAAEEAWDADNGGALFSGDSYEHTFETTGEHAYFCIPHESEGMVGTVTVSEDATPTE